ncbi:MAG: histidine kinase [Gammaproteobacteria bacterium]|nr:histidine kinase [Gammaproteobacteria bacterium]
MLSENQQRPLKLTLVCSAAGTLLYALGLTDVLWLSLFISLGMGFTVCYSWFGLQRISPKMPLSLQVFLAGLIAVATWGGGILPLLLRHVQLAPGVSVEFWLHSRSLLLMAVVTLVISYFYYSRERFFLLQKTADKTEIQRVKQEVEAMELRWRLLQSQLEPHFLFNTLANIQALIELDPKQAGEMLLALTTLLRQNLNNTRENWMSLADELQFNKAYLAIQKIRLGKRLQVRFDIGEKVGDNLLLPPMLLQPLIENAVVHGIEPLKKGGILHLEIKLEGEQLLIQIYNDGTLARSEASRRGHNIGLSNTRSRLKHFYGEAACFSIGAQKPQGVLVKLEIPCRYTTVP